MRMRNPALLASISLASLSLLPSCGGGTTEPSTPKAEPAESGPAKGGAHEEPKSESGKKEEASTDGAKKGAKAPSLGIESVNGQGKLSVAPGKVTIVDFWATWCEPCKKSFPKYQELYVKYKASGLEILAVSVDDEAKDVAPFAKKYGAKFPVGWDEGKKIAERWKPENMPTAFIVDKAGVVRYVHNGYRVGEEREIEKELKELL